jgi:hypothetical protein
VVASFPEAPQEVAWGLKTANGLLGGTIVDTPLIKPGGAWFAVYCVFVPQGFDLEVAKRGFEEESTRGIGKVTSKRFAIVGGEAGVELVIEGVGIRRRIQYAMVGERLIGAGAPAGTFWSKSDERFFRRLRIDSRWRRPSWMR